MSDTTPSSRFGDRAEGSDGREDDIAKSKVCTGVGVPQGGENETFVGTKLELSLGR